MEKGGSLWAGVVGEVSMEKETLELPSCRIIRIGSVGMAGEGLTGEQIALAKIGPCEEV